MGTITDQILRKPKPVAGQGQLDAARARNIAAANNIPVVDDNAALSAAATASNPTEPIAPPVAPVGPLDAVRPSPSMIGKAEVAQSNKPTTITHPTARPKSYLEIFQMLNPAMSPDDEAAERERRKRDGMMTAIGDAIGALANLWGTSKGAVNAYDANASMSAANRRYWDKLTAERHANKDRYNNLMLQALRMDMDKDRDGYNREMAMRNLLEGMRQYNESSARADRQFAYTKGKDAAELALRDKIAGLNNATDIRRTAMMYGERNDVRPTPYALSTGEVIEVPKSAESVATISAIYNRLPEAFRKAYETQITSETDALGEKKLVERSRVPELAEMQTAIGAYIKSGAADAPLIDDELRALAGRKRLNEGLVIPEPEPEPVSEPEEQKKSRKEIRKERRKERKESKNQPAPGSKGKAY